MALSTDNEISRCETLSILNAGKTQIDRNRLGQFATPPSLALDIVRASLCYLPEGRELRFLEPGFGTGAFFSAIHHLVEGSRIQSAVGYEIDPYYGRPAANLWKECGLTLQMEDFTSSEPPRNINELFNLVVCNPPYVRHHHLSMAQKSELRGRILQHFGLEINGLTGLYAYFMILSQRWMVANGVGAWLIPSEFMDVKYGRKVKEFLLQHVTLLRIHRCNPCEVQFDDAMVSSAIVFFRNSPPPLIHYVDFTFGGTVSSPSNSIQIGLGELNALQKWTHFAHAKPQTTATDDFTLSDLFSIKRGLATGDNKFFVLDNEQINRLKLPREFMIPILPSPRYLSSDEIAAEENGDPKIERKRYLLSCDLEEEDVRQKFPSLWEYVQQGVSIGVRDRYICRHRRPWYRQEKRPAAPLLCSYMGRTTPGKVAPFRFIRNHSQATAANVYLMLYPRRRLQRILDIYPHAIDLIWEELNAITSESLIREGRIYGGGLHKMEPNELGNVSASRLLEALSPFEDFQPNIQRDLFATR